MRYCAAMVAMAAASGSIAAQTPTIPAALQPSGPWKVDYGDEMCLLSRAFGTASDAVTLGVRTGVSNDNLTLFLIRPAASGGSVSGSVSISADGQTLSEKSRYVERSVGGTGVRLTTADLPRSTLRMIAGTGGATIAFDGGRVQRFALPSLSKALDAMKTCEDKLKAKWGMDMAAQARVAVPAEFTDNPADLFTAQVYPPDALIARQTGRTIALLWIGDDGRVRKCNIAVSSKSRSLDSATCAVAFRARLKPAKDANGASIETQEFLSVTWSL